MADLIFSTFPLLWVEGFEKPFLVVSGSAGVSDILIGVHFGLLVDTRFALMMSFPFLNQLNMIKSTLHPQLFQPSYPARTSNVVIFSLKLTLFLFSPLPTSNPSKPSQFPFTSNYRFHCVIGRSCQCGHRVFTVRADAVCDTTADR